MPFTPEDLLADDSFLNYCFDRNPDHTIYWTNAIQADPQLAVQARDAQKIIEGIQYTFDEANAPAAFAALKTKLNPLKAVKPLWQKPWLAAAVVAGLVGVWLAVVPARQLNPIVFLTTQFAQAKQWKTADSRSIIALPDGTKVTLGYNSTLTLAKDFNQEKRNLELLGEAFFEVAKDAQKPFVVRSKHISTQALGTAFLVEAYANQVGVKVWLEEGKVQVSDQKTRATLKAGQSAFGLQEGHIDKDKFDYKTINNWKADQLLFDNSSFSTVLTQLAMHYGVQFHVNKMPQRPLSFTGNLSGQPLSESLDVIAAVHHFSFELAENQKVEITFE